MKRLTLPYSCIRTVTNPHLVDLGLKVYTGYLNIVDLLKIPTDDNVRGYIVDAGKHRKRTKVHRAIEECLVETPDLFSVLNSGVTVVARSAKVRDADKKVDLELPSIINGANTQGVVRDVLEGYEEVEENWVRFDLLVGDSEEIITSVTIARNFQNAVQDLSIFGKKNMFKELEKVTGLPLRHSETDQDDNLVDTTKLIQVLTTMTPPALWNSSRLLHNGRPVKTYAYNMKNRCLKEFAATWTSAKDPLAEDHEEQRKLYDFYLQQGAFAWGRYCRWKSGKGFKGEGKKLRKGVIRTKNGKKIVEISDGYVFPIMAAESLLYEKRGSEWKISIHKGMEAQLEASLIDSAIYAYREIAHTKHFEMGRSKNVHEHVAQVVISYKTWAKAFA